MDIHASPSACSAQTRSSRPLASPLLQKFVTEFTAQQSNRSVAVSADVCRLLADVFLQSQELPTPCPLLYSEIADEGLQQQALDAVDRAFGQSLPANQGNYQTSASVLARTALLKWYADWQRDRSNTAAYGQLQKICVRHAQLFGLTTRTPDGVEPAFLRKLQEVDAPAAAMLKNATRHLDSVTLAFMAETLWRAASHTDRVCPPNDRWGQFEQIGGVWILVALDGERREAAAPAGLLVRLQIERIEHGNGCIYPCPATSAHVVPGPVFRAGIQRAAACLARKDSGFLKYDYRWRLALIDEERLDSQTPLHRKRADVVRCGVNGESGSLGFAAALYSSFKQLPLDFGSICSGYFTDEAASSGKLATVQQLSVKLGNDIDFRRLLNSGRLRTLVMCEGQQIAAEIPAQVALQRCSDFDAAWLHLTCHWMITRAYREGLRKELSFRFQRDGGHGFVSTVVNAEGTYAWAEELLVGVGSYKLRLQTAETPTDQWQDLEWYRIPQRVNRLLRAAANFPGGRGSGRAVKSDRRLPQHLIFVGPSGAGKTCLLEAVAVQYALEPAVLQKLRLADRVPVVVRNVPRRLMTEPQVTQLLELLLSSAGPIFRTSETEFDFPQRREWMLQLLHTGRLLVLLDDCHPAVLSQLLRFFGAHFSRTVILAGVREAYFGILRVQQNIRTTSVIHVDGLTEDVALCRLEEAGWDISNLQPQDSGRSPAADAGDHPFPRVFYCNPLVNGLLCRYPLFHGSGTNTVATLRPVRWELYSGILGQPGGMFARAVAITQQTPLVQTALTDSLISRLLTAALTHLPGDPTFRLPLSGLVSDILREAPLSRLPNADEVAGELLNKLWFLREDPGGDGTRLHWRHPSFGEYFAGRGLAEKLSSHNDSERLSGMLLLQKLHSWVDLPKSAEFGHAITARGARVPALEWQAVFCAALFWASRQGPEALECVAAALLACGNVHVLMHAERVDQLVSQTHSQRLARWLYGQLPEQGFGTSGAAAEDLQAGLRNLSVHRNEQLRRTLYFRDVRNPDLLAALRQLSLVCGVSSSTRGLWSDISEPVLSLGSFQTTLLERMSAQDDWIRVANHTQALEVATFPVSWADYEVFCPWHRTCRSSSLPSEQPVGWVSLNAAREYCCWLNDLAHMMGRPYRFLLPDCVVLDELSNNTGLRKSLDFEWCEWNLADFRTASSPTGVVFSAAEQSRRYAFEPGVNIGFRVCRQRIAEK